MSITATVIVSAILLWFAQGWYLNKELVGVHKKLDSLTNQFDGLREYLYEIDPQFDEERQLWNELNEAVDDNAFSFSGMDHMQLLERKKKQGLRTLDTHF